MKQTFSIHSVESSSPVYNPLSSSYIDGVVGCGNTTTQYQKTQIQLVRSIQTHDKSTVTHRPYLGSVSMFGVFLIRNSATSFRSFIRTSCKEIDFIQSDTSRNIVDSDGCGPPPMLLVVLSRREHNKRME